MYGLGNDPPFLRFYLFCMGVNYSLCLSMYKILLDIICTIHFGSHTKPHSLLLKYLIPQTPSTHL